MIQTFKIWISALLCLGIFVTFLELIIPNSKFKKYIYVLIGIITVITIVSPLINAYKNDQISSSLNEVTKAMSNSFSESELPVDNSKVQSDQQQLVKQQFIDSIKKDVTDKLTLRGINVEDVKVIINDSNDSYDIQKITITIKKIDSSKSSIDSVNKVVDYVNQEYDIEYSKIFVIEKGE